MRATRTTRSPSPTKFVSYGGDGKATRKARVLAKGLRHKFGVIDNSMFWLLERSSSFDRGGRALTVYQLAS